MDSLHIGFSSYARILQLAEHRRKLLENLALIDKEMDLLVYPGEERVDAIKQVAKDITSSLAALSDDVDPDTLGNQHSSKRT